MIAFSLARSKQVLWIEFPLAISQESYSGLDEDRAAVLQREGPMDLIMDFTATVPAAFPPQLAHVRALVPKVEVVRSLHEAFSALNVDAGDFVRLPMDATAGPEML